MPLREIVRLGHPALRTQAGEVPEPELGSPDLLQLVRDMEETLEAADGVGLAAPQLGIGRQVFLWEVVGPAGDRRGEVRAIVNPMLEAEGGELVYDWEGCLSIPDLRGLVPRHPAVRLHGSDPEGRAIDLQIEGYEARVVQHEFDHLNGIVFLDRMRDLKSLSYGIERETYLSAADESEPAVG